MWVVGLGKSISKVIVYMRAVKHTWCRLVDSLLGFVGCSFDMMAASAKLFLLPFHRLFVLLFAMARLSKKYESQTRTDSRVDNHFIHLLTTFGSFNFLRLLAQCDPILRAGEFRIFYTRHGLGDTSDNEIEDIPSAPSPSSSSRPRPVEDQSFSLDLDVEMAPPSAIPEVVDLTGQLLLLKRLHISQTKHLGLQK